MVRHFTNWVLAGLLLVSVASARGAVECIPEAKQAALASKILAASNRQVAKASARLHVVYFTPSDREPEPRYRERLEAILEDIRAFYREGMAHAGFGPKTFDLDRDEQGKVIIHLVKGNDPESAYPRSGFVQNGGADASTRDKIMAASRPVLQAAGIAPEHDTTIIFCNLAKWDEKTRFFQHHSPYMGFWTQTGGWCFAVDCSILDIGQIAQKQPTLRDAEWGVESIGKFNTVFIGGIAHELGHAFGLPHCGRRWDEQALGQSLMGSGNHTYREELRGEGRGSFLTMASAMKLAGRPLFSKSNDDRDVKPRLDQCDFDLTTKALRPDLADRRGTLRVEGTVKATPPVYGVIAYFDFAHDGGYTAPAATAVPDAQGRYAIEISDLAPCRYGDLRIEYCHVNGTFSERHDRFAVTKTGAVNLDVRNTIKALEPLGKAVMAQDLNTATRELERIQKSDAPALAKTTAGKLVATLQNETKRAPADASADATRLALGDAKWEAASVGWLIPSANRIPKGDVASPLLDCQTIYATGLFAHAPSRYVFDLGGKWTRLRGEAGLHTPQQAYGSVVFVIRADGKEVFRSSVIRNADLAKYDIDVTGGKLLELIVEDGGDGNRNDWGLWLDPTLLRGRS